MIIKSIFTVALLAVSIVSCNSAKQSNQSSETVSISDGNNEIENKKWTLTELYGKKVKGDATSHYLIFHSESNTVEAKAGCNQLTFGYKIKNGLSLEITPGISTMMACPDEIEDEFKKMMLEIDNVSVNEKTLTLNKARMAPLAVFEIAE